MIVITSIDIFFMENSSHLIYDSISIYDLDFIKSLFDDEDIRFYYILHEEHQQDISKFVKYIIDTQEKGTSLNYKISLYNGLPIGFIGGELRRLSNGNIAWNISYAIHPVFRNYGFATEALSAFTNYIKKYSICLAYLDISSSNVCSEAVARKAGYVKNQTTGYLDPEHEELGFRFHWEIRLHSGRDLYFSMGVNAHQNKEYRKAESYFAQALNEEYEGNLNTDAMCYSNMGMACSSYGNYEKAFKCLKIAQSLGLTNPTIEKELLWLKNNVGLF